MLIQLQIQNFRSFNERQTFVTVQGSTKRFPDHVHEHESGIKILKTTGIYGTNGSGKTNLFKALYFLKKLVIDEDFLNSIESIKYFTAFKLNKLSEVKPCHFEVDFIGANNNVYVYSVAILPQEKKIVEEKLVRLHPIEEIIFHRYFEDNRVVIDTPNKPELSQLKNLFHNIISNNALFLSSDIFDDEDLDAARNWFTNQIEFMFPTYDFNDIAYIFTLKPEYLKLANDIIKISNVGIDKLDLERIPISIYFGLEYKDLIRHISGVLEEHPYYSFKDNLGNYCTAIKGSDEQISIVKLLCYHYNNANELVPFDVDQESRGTIVLLHLIPALIRSYGEGINYFLDDINTSLHPVLLKEILSQYLTLNLGAAKGQLIFNSHEDFLMDEKIVRQDELWLMDKVNGASTLFPLSDFDVRFDLNYRKNYLNGKFGAVPFKEEPEKMVFG